MACVYTPIGGPAAGTTLEEMIALGAKWCIMVGSAGSLQKHINIGDVCIIDRAVRDEGTSYHYLRPSKYVEAEGKICDLFEAVLKENGIPYYRGSAWTTDAPYTERVDEVRRYQDEGVLCVEMEAASLFAIAKVRGIEIGLLVNISDDLSSLEWSPHFHDYLHKLSEEKRVEIVLKVIERINF